MRQIEDLGAVSIMYSQLAGVLAGFAFAGIVVIVSGTMSGNSNSGPAQVFAARETLAAMVCSFFALALTALTYAATGADTARPGSLAAEQLLADVEFLIAGQLSVFSVLELIRASVGGDVFYYANRLLSQFSAIPMFALLCVGFDSYLDIRYSGDPPGWVIPGTFALIALLLTVGIVGFTTFGWVAFKRLHVGWSISLPALAAIGLVAMTTCTLAVGWLAAHDAPAGWTPPLPVAVGTVLLGFAGAVTLPLCLYLRRKLPTAFAVGERVRLAADRHYLRGDIERWSEGKVTRVRGLVGFHVRYTVEFDGHPRPTPGLDGHDLQEPGPALIPAAMRAATIDVVPEPAPEPAPERRVRRWLGRIARRRRGGPWRTPGRR